MTQKSSSSFLIPHFPGKLLNPLFPIESLYSLHATIGNRLLCHVFNFPLDFGFNILTWNLEIVKRDKHLTYTSSSCNPGESGISESWLHNSWFCHKKEKEKKVNNLFNHLCIIIMYFHSEYQGKSSDFTAYQNHNDITCQLTWNKHLGCQSLM